MFVVYLTIYSGDKLPPLYIGSTSKLKLESGYCGSVSSREFKSIFHSEVKDNPELFDTIILEECGDRKTALEVELHYQRLYNVVKSDTFINKSTASVNGFFGMDVSGDNNPRFGSKLSDHQRKAFSDANTGMVTVNIDGVWCKISSTEYRKSPHLYSTPKGEFNVATADTTRKRVVDGTHHFCDPSVQAKIQDKRKESGWTHTDGGRASISTSMKVRNQQLGSWGNGYRQGNKAWLYCVDMHIIFKREYDSSLRNFRTPIKKEILAYGVPTTDKFMNHMISKFIDGWNPSEDEKYIKWVEDESK